MPKASDFRLLHYTPTLCEIYDAGARETFYLPITNQFDRQGNDTEDWKDTVVFTCGKDDLWINFRPYGPPETLH